MDVSIIIPTKDEEKNLRIVMNNIRKFFRKRHYTYEIIIVDKYSTDNTVKISKKYRARVLYDDLGKGSAIRKGLNAAKGNIIITMDADCSHIPQEIGLLVEGIECGFDICMGSRFIQGGGTEDMPWYRRAGNKFFVSLVNLLWGMHYSDLCYGYRSFKKSCIKKLDLKSNGFGIETEIAIHASKNRLRVLEVPSFEKNRFHGSGNLRTFKDGWLILKTIFREAFD